jgi:WD40 repeat protein
MVSSISLSSDSRILASGSRDKTVRCWDIRTKKETIIGKHDKRVRCVSISSDSRFIASGSHDKTVKLWNI